MVTSKRLILIAVLLLPAIVGCRGGQPPQIASASASFETDLVEAEVGTSIKGAPDWVNNGSQLFAGKDKRLFYGVGYAAPMGDMALQKSVADDMARAKVARVFTLFLDTVAKDYIAADRMGSAGAKNRDQKEEKELQLIRNANMDSMASARISGSWRDLKSNNIWSIAELDMQHVKSTIAGAGDSSADFKRYFEATANDIFDRMVRERISVRPAAAR